MKIGIDARFLSHPQRGGFKTYTTNLIKSLSEVDSANEYYLYLDRQLPEEHVHKKENWHYKVVGGNLPLVGMPVREQLFLKRQIAKDQLDVVHFLCNTAPLNVNNRYVITLHDTIQVTAQNRFRPLGGPASYKQWAMLAYSKGAINNSIKSAGRIITVSNYEKEQISTQFGISPERVCAIHLAPNPIYRPATAADKSIWRSKLPALYGIKRKFILGVGWERRKNIGFLIETFSRLSSEFEYLDLVIVCAEEKTRAYFEKLKSDYGVAEKTVILGSLPAEELVILYNLAEAFIYPSERESFGLPPLEAISCGTPTVAMNISSVPEILKDGAILIDGKNHKDWVQAIQYVMSDERVRLDLVEHGLRRAAQFSWQHCAEETIQVYKEIAESPKDL
jgi:glycosyltransferase involved in cell wall biosynthesis